ncbi:hypothetical protein [Helicovermis profundi]|uniref:DUF4181 domain-containing protein n=1 Tax=Helicovermis profundi TaxID=3065157 RepID=A0AAU9E3M2_9FIRM|nr:hypothetical protein HLPR_01690 [Clostridia bacterium S502]
MLDFISMIVGVISIGITIGSDIKAYTVGVYNPYLFRMRMDYEWKKLNVISYFGFSIPIFIIQDIFYKFVYIAILSFSMIVSRIILNYKCYKLDLDRRILFETFIFSVIFITIIMIFYTLI